MAPPAASSFAGGVGQLSTPSAIGALGSERGAANAELRESTDGITHSSLRLSASDQDIRDKAQAWALAGKRLSVRYKDLASSTWRIRQFQFFGGPSVTVWRELRRLPDAVFESETVEAARQAADAGDWQTYMEVMGGAGCEQRARPIKLATQWSDREGTYGEPLGEIVFGVRCGDLEVQTRIHVWSVVDAPRQRAGVAVNLSGATEFERAGGLTDLESCQ